jgi:hypothetical protein
MRDWEVEFNHARDSSNARAKKITELEAELKAKDLEIKSLLEKIPKVSWTNEMVVAQGLELKAKQIEVDILREQRNGWVRACSQRISKLGKDVKSCIDENDQEIREALNDKRSK